MMQLSYNDLKKRGWVLCIYLSVFLCAGSITAVAQCPPNIGFEKGNFDNWQCLKGKIERSGEIYLNPVSPDGENHRIIDAKISEKEKDVYGGFPVVCPNGSGYSVKLGMEQGGSDAHGLSYTFTVPQTSGDYSIIYNYAVVLENPTHNPHEQPLFGVKVFNVTDNKYEDCGSFQFIAAANLPGFKLASGSRPNVYYKDWAPITLKLPGFEGKTLRLEFTVNDCSLGGHFGYAYVDINENCTTPITGNVICNGISSLTLTAPYGFLEYKWMSEDFSTTLGNNNTLKLSPAPPPGTRLALEIVPYPNQGCLDTLFTTIASSDEDFEFNLVPSIEACETPGLDITKASLTQGSTPGMVYSYFADVQESSFVANPKQVIQSGTYYIKAVNIAGCTTTKPLQAFVNKNPILKITGDINECIPNTIDLTAPSITKNSEGGLSFTYWEDAIASKKINIPTAINKSGTYFIQATNQFGCKAIEPVLTSITQPPVVVTNNLVACGQLNLSTVNPVLGSDPSATPSYWEDAAATIPIAPNFIFTSTTNYYAKLTSIFGCAVTKPAKVTINQIPSFAVTDPSTVRIPQTVNLLSAAPYSPSWQYSYWEDAATTKRLMTPERILKTGTYFIKATSNEGCNLTRPVNVTIEDADIKPSNIFSPNGDGINDYWLIPLIEYYPESTIEIFTRNGQSIYRSKSGYTRVWDGKANDGYVVPVGVYYYLIKASPKLKPISGTVTVIY